MRSPSRRELRTVASDEAELELFRRFAATRDRTIRNELVERHMGLAAHIARRLSRAGTRDDDVRQVAMVGLVKAIDRFDPSYGHAFAAFAGATIEGEIKRYFRDHSWSVRVPRAAKELHLLLRDGVDELQQRTGRSPSVDELASYLEIDRDEVLRGFAASAAYRAGSLDGSARDDDADPDHSAVLADDETGFDHVADTDMVTRLLACLAEREREIVRLRIFEQRSQSDIASIVGVSQMHVSRLLRRSFEQMRAAVGAEELAEAGIRQSST